MIPKISSGSNYYGLLSYLEDKADKLVPTEKGMDVVIGTQRIFVNNFDIENNISLNTDKQVLNKDFQEWDLMAKNKNFENKVAHFSLSFAPHDTLDKTKIITIANDFLDKMGYKNNPVAIYQHNDKHHNHIHIVTSRVGEDGKKISHDKELIHAIRLCRELELTYNLTKVVKGERTQNNLDKSNSKTITASGDVPFRNAIIQNLQYYIHNERVVDIETLQKKLLLHKIEMVLHDKDGNRLPKNGVRFYYKEGNKIISYISGSGIEKKFIANLESKLNANATKTYVKAEEVKQVTEEKVYIPTLKPNFAVQKAICKDIFEAMQSCVNSIMFSQNDLVKILEVHKIVPEFKTDNAGNLTGLSFIYNDVRYKGSDFTFQGIKLSAQLLAPYYTQNMDGAKAIQIAINATQGYIKGTGDNLLSKQEIMEVLNRNNIKLVERADSKNYLLINHFGKNYSINLNNYPGGYKQFLQNAGYDNKTVLSSKLQPNIERPTQLVSTLNLKERAVYAALLKGSTKEIQEISKLQIKIILSSSEKEKLSKPIGLLRHYNDIHNNMSKSSAYLNYLQKKTNIKPDISETIKALNLRGIAVIPTFETVTKEGIATKQLKKVDFSPIGDSTGNPPLNFFQTITAFSSEKLKELFENPHPKDELLLNQPVKEPGVYFEFSPEITSLILAAESEPSLIHEYKDEVLDQHPELEKEIEYIESLEEVEANKGLYIYPDSNFLSTLFKDHGRMVNRGADGPSFKALKSKSKQKRR